MTDDATSPDDSETPASDERRCYCPLDGIIDLLSRKYAIQVICVVGALEPVRYSEIETTFGEVSSSTLSTRLSELTAAGLLDRQQHDTIPPQVEYTLTADGEELCSLLEPLLEWLERRDRLETDSS